MKSSQSRYAKRASEPNPWREVPIHESNLIAALEFAMTMSTELKKSEEIERVLVGEPVNGVYPLSVAIVSRSSNDAVKRKEARTK